VDSPTPAEARALVEEVRERHTKDRSRLFLGFVCGHCTGEETGFREGIKWPCDASRLASALEASLAEVERLKESFVASEHLRQDMDAALVRAGLRFNEELKRNDEFQAHENQTHEELGAILGTDTSLLAGAKRLHARLEASLKREEGLSLMLQAMVHAACTIGNIGEWATIVNRAREALASTGAPE
jgi:hypothetical protein